MADQVCVVIGVGPGLGMAVARRFGRGGYALALLARREEAVQAYAVELQQDGFTARGYSADAGDSASLRAALARVQAEQGDIDVLVYNAVSASAGKAMDLDPEALVQSFRVNVLGAMLATQSVIEGMRQRGRGSILLTGGGLGIRPYPDYTALSMGKAALRNLGLNLFAELAPSGIHAAMVTVAGGVQTGSFFDPDRIAESYWRLHEQPAGAWEAEIIYQKPAE